MNTKCTLLLATINLVVMVTPVFSQSSALFKAVVGGDSQAGNVWYAPVDTTVASALPDSLYATLLNGWHKVPGQMPVQIPGHLPNSMPILSPPPVDEKMIIPLVSVPADSLKRPQH